MPLSEIYNRPTQHSLDSGIHFEALEPRILLSGTPDGIVADNQQSDSYPSDLTVVETEDINVYDESDTLTFDLAIYEASTETASEDTELSESIDPDNTISTDPSAVPSVGEDTAAVAEDAVDGTVSTSDPDDGDTFVDTPESITGIEDVSLVEETAPDGTLLMQAEDATNSTDTEIIPALLTDDTTVVGVPKELVFVNDDIQDYDQLTEDLSAQQVEGREITVVTLDSATNGIEQISSVLSESENVDAVHFVSHGTDRAVKLGGTWIDNTTIEDYAPAIAAWRDSLAADADLLFYGCELAGGENGRTLIEAFGELTDADVAASTDSTGNAIYDADWDLEYTAGNIETSVAFSNQIQENWMGLLNTYTVTNTNDAGAGSLRQAITNANANGGLDTIDFSPTSWSARLNLMISAR